jgi:hypothetical protein
MSSLEGTYPHQFLGEINIKTALMELDVGVIKAERLVW